MSKIVIGTAGRRAVQLDLKLLLRTRALVTANSGGGKSYLLRRMAEQLFGKVPVWIIDPEGEFASLREKFGFVLVGKGGETPADPRSAALVAQKLRELNASAVFDLYDLKPPTRHAWVRAFLEGLMNQPKVLWRPLVLKIDEAHKFCPEKGAGESEAFEAVQDVATRGRKRGICTIPYTQRLANISKTVTAELLNRLVGMTREDVDIERAVKVLSVARADQEAFGHDIKKLQPGEFYGLGPAISNDRILITVGTVITTHPEVGEEISDTPPPAPEKIRALLPKLADLPKEAEEKAKGEAELKAEIRSLKAQLAQAGRRDLSSKPAKVNLSAQPRRVIRTVEVKLLGEMQVDRLRGEVRKLGPLVTSIEHAAHWVREAAARIEVTAQKADQKLKAHAEKPCEPPATFVKRSPVPVKQIEALARRITPTAERIEPPVERSGEISQAQGRILKALADFAAIGRHDVSKTWLAARAGASHKSSSFGNNLGALRAQGLIEYRDGNVRATAAGFNVCPVPGAPMSTQEMLDSCMGLLTDPQSRILRAAFEAYPEVVPKEDMAAKAQASPTSSSFGNNLGALRSAGMIEYVTGGIKCADWIFVDR